MRLEQLEYLIELSKTHSISAAAKHLHISHQSLSKSIQNLEEELEISLVDRNNKGITLTALGQQVVDTAQNVLAELNTLNELKFYNHPPATIHGNIKIMFCNAFNIAQITSSINGFSTEYPNVYLDIQKGSLATILEQVYDLSIDIGLISLPGDYHLSQKMPIEQLKNLIIEPLSEDKLLVAVSKVSPLAKRQSISMNTLLKYPLIHLKNTEDDIETTWLTDLLKPYGTPNFVLSTNSGELYLKAIAENTGVGFFTQNFKKSSRFSWQDNVKLIPFRPSISMYYSYIINRSKPLSPLAKAYLPFLFK